MKNMTQPAWQAYIIWLLKANLVVWAINGLLFAAVVFSGSSPAGLLASNFFTIITLVETGVAFLIAGAVAFSGSVLPSKAREQILKSGEQWSMEKLRKGEKRANKFIVLGVILFLESLLISLLGF